MSATGKKIAIGVFCADWRLHQEHVQIVTKVRDHLGVDAVDMLVTAGPEGVVKNPARAGERETLKDNLNLLIGAHHPTTVAFIAHQRCAGHPVSDEQHEADIAETMRMYQELTGFAGDMAALVATYASDNEWGLKEVGRVSSKK